MPTPPESGVPSRNEAIELPDRRFVLGVQWHPEADERSREIEALVHAAARYRDACAGPQRTAIGSP